MQEPESPTSSSLPPKPWSGRRRRRRTVFRMEQVTELEKVFAINHFPSYDAREALAARLGLKENHVQVWFKNRRAKERRTQRQTRQQSAGAGASTQSREVGAPAPVPAPDGRAVPGAPAFLGGPGFGSAPPPGPFGGVPAADSGGSGHSQAWWGPSQDPQGMVRAAPAGAPAMAPSHVPVWPELSDGGSFFTGSWSPGFPGPRSASCYGEARDSVEENGWDPSVFLDLKGIQSQPGPALYPGDTGQ